MGMFKKTLNDAESAIKKNNFQAALNIVNQHIETEHVLNSDANRLVRDVVLLQDDLVALRAVLGTLVRTSMPSQMKANALELIEGSRRIVNALVMQCNKIVRDEKKEV